MINIYIPDYVEEVSLITGQRGYVHFCAVMTVLRSSCALQLLYAVKCAYIFIYHALC